MFEGSGLKVERLRAVILKSKGMSLRQGLVHLRALTLSREKPTILVITFINNHISSSFHDCKKKFAAASYHLSRARGTRRNLTCAM